jgi:hypothetical protein
MLTAVRNWVIRTMMKSKGETGIVRTLPNKDLIELNTQVTAQRLMQNGIDPQLLKNADQVENAIIAIESKPKTGGVINTKSAKVFDMEGKEIPKGSKIMGGKAIDDDLPPPGSRGGKDDIAAPVQSSEETIKNMIEAENKKNNAQLVAEDLAEKKFGKEFYDLDQKQQMDLYDEALEGLSEQTRGMPDPEDFAQGGIARLGFKDGMTRRTFLKILGGAMSIPIIGKFLKPMKVGKTVTKVPMIKTDDVAGKPEWFDQLVNKVIIEGDDVTKKFATGERQSIHQKTLDDGTVVRVTEDIDDGAVRVEYQSEKNVFGDDVQLQYRKPKPDEGDPNPTAEFTTAESGPVGKRYGPDDYEIDVDEVGGTSIKDLDSDVSKLKEYATGKKPTMKEFIQNKKRQDKAKAISEDMEAQSDAVIRRQGEAQDSDYETLGTGDDFASGGIAGLLGE